MSTLHTTNFLDISLYPLKINTDLTFIPNSQNTSTDRKLKKIFNFTLPKEANILPTIIKIKIKTHTYIETDICMIVCADINNKIEGAP